MKSHNSNERVRIYMAKRQLKKVDDHVVPNLERKYHSKLLTLYREKVIYHEACIKEIDNRENK